MSTLPSNTMSMSRAASVVGITRPALFALLRDQGYIYNNNLPTPTAIQSGLLTTHIRSYHNPVSGISNQYQVTHVTAKGLSWIQEMVTHGKTPTRIRGTHYRPADATAAA